MKKTHYRPDKELILTSNQNTLSNSITRDIKKTDYDSIREIVEDKQEIIYKNNKENKVKKILPSSDANRKILPPENKNNINKKKYKNNIIYFKIYNYG